MDHLERTASNYRQNVSWYFGAEHINLYCCLLIDLFIGSKAHIVHSLNLFVCVNVSVCVCVCVLLNA